MKSIIVANWKMNPATFREAKLLFDATKKAAEKSKSAQIIVAPPSIFLRNLAVGYRGRIAFAIQNGFQESAGAYTGEISFAQAYDARATYALIGHAERRAMGETNEHTRLKVSAALKSEITPILCVGEITRDSTGQHFAYIREQLRLGLADVAPSSIKKILIAYEPVWAIGATKPMTARDMHEMAIFIRKAVVELFGEGGMETKILYGGSIDEISAPIMLRDGDVKGLLVGRASAEVGKITKLLAAVETA
jgi:triosephosphate isomerase